MAKSDIMTKSLHREWTREEVDLQAATKKLSDMLQSVSNTILRWPPWYTCHSPVLLSLSGCRQN